MLDIDIVNNAIGNIYGIEMLPGKSHIFTKYQIYDIYSIISKYNITDIELRDIINININDISHFKVKINSNNNLFPAKIYLKKEIK